MKNNEFLRVYGKQYKELTKTLLETANLDREIREKAAAEGLGSRQIRIGIKPNLVCPTPAGFGGTTHPEIIDGIIEYLFAKGFSAEQITVLEGAWVGDKTSEAFDYCGYLHIPEQYGVKLIDLQKDGSTPIQAVSLVRNNQKERSASENAKGMQLNICPSLLDVDFLINVPVLKGHCQTKVTCALKNMKGLIPNSEKRRFHTMGLHKPIAYLNTVIHQDFIVIDHICGDPDFEEGGNPLERNCIMAAKDPVLVDAYTCLVLGYETNEVRYITLAEELGVGSTDISKLELKTLAGEITKGEPGDTVIAEENANGAAQNLNDIKAGFSVPETRKLVEISYAIDEMDSCSACFGMLAPALDRLKNEGLLEQLMEKLGGEKICIGQGHRGKSGKFGIGNCTAGFAFSVKGCPPKEEEIYQALKSFLKA